MTATQFAHFQNNKRNFFILNMRTEHPKYAALGNEGLPGFNWSEFDGGWNGISLKVNTKVKVKKGSNDKVYSHEPYAQQEYNQLSSVVVQNVKDVTKGTTVPVDDMHLVNDTTLSVTVGGGANNVLVDMTKENQFFRILERGEIRLDCRGRRLRGARVAAGRARGGAPPNQAGGERDFP